MYIYIYGRAYEHTCKTMYTYVCVCIKTNIYLNKEPCMHINIYIYICMCVHIVFDRHGDRFRTPRCF